MRAVNLLPASYRPVRPSGARKGSGYAVIGVLGALLLAATVYILSVNQISSREGELARAKVETEQAEARAAKLGPFGEFAAIKATRTASVKMLAAGRIDWERAMRELSLVLPANVWLTQLDASTGGKAPDGDAAPSAGAPAEEGEDNPTLKVTGCARRQRDVAILLVRLRALHGAEEAKLAKSTQPEEEAAAASGAAGGEADGGSDEDCKAPYYRFEASVAFEANASGDPAPRKARKGLGGGS